MVDAMVGKVMDAVKQSGIENNTLIIFTSDNGCSPAADFKELQAVGHYPSYIYRGEKSDIFEGGHRIPFIAKWPGKIQQGSSSNATICLTDLLATCADLFHQPLPENAGEDSYSLLPLLLKDNRKYKRKDIVHHSIDGDFSIRKGKWKLEFCAGSGGWSYPTSEDLKTVKLPPNQLYDMLSDPSEKKNLASKHPEIVKELTLLMEKYIKDGRSTPGKNQKNEVEVILRKDNISKLNDGE